MPLLLVAGHQRSGTNILRILLNSHPEIAATNEFANLKLLASSRFVYSTYILWRALQMYQKGGSFNLIGNEATSWRTNTFFALKYFLLMQRSPGVRMDFPDAESALHALFPQKRWVGDKFPDYIWEFPRFVDSGKITCIAIYRDARDVVSSSLESARTTWKGTKFGHNFDSVEKIATRWQKSIERMEQTQSRILSIRYEHLIANPKDVANEIGRRLDVDPEQFPVYLLRDSSIGKHRQLLSNDELASVERIAGDTMARLGYTR
jgi:hypothetical protein